MLGALRRPDLVAGDLIQCHFNLASSENSPDGPRAAVLWPIQTGAHSALGGYCWLFSAGFWSGRGRGEGEASWAHMGSAVNVHEGLLAGVTPNFTHRLHMYL